jgi:hypothetical protein
MFSTALLITSIPSAIDGGTALCQGFNDAGAA